MFRSSRYKRSQGKVARQITFLALAAVAAIGAWKLSTAANNNWSRYVVPLAIAGVGAWAAFRAVNIPRFADFLISVEAEMNKVSWPSRAELYRASLVVIVVIFLLTGILFGYDAVLRWLVGVLMGVGR
jgi:preprotein translocase subunit SecE